MDSRIRTLVENCHKLGQRSMFVIVGDKGRDQVVNLHYMLSKTAVKARPSVLWCYKKDLYLSRCARIKVLGKFSKVRTPVLAKPGADVLQPGVILDHTVSGLTMLQGTVLALRNIFAPQSSQEAHAADQEDDGAGPAGPREGGPLLALRGLHQHPLLLLPRHPQDPGQHLRHVRAAGRHCFTTVGPFYLPK